MSCSLQSKLVLWKCVRVHSSWTCQKSFRKQTSVIIKWIILCCFHKLCKQVLCYCRGLINRRKKKWSDTQLRPHLHLALTCNHQLIMLWILSGTHSRFISTRWTQSTQKNGKPTCSNLPTLKTFDQNHFIFCVLPTIVIFLTSEIICHNLCSVLWPTMSIEKCA